MNKQKKWYQLRCVLALLVALIIVFSQTGIKVEATYSMPGYENPKDIIISTPKDQFSTTASKVSILGACNYQYPLYMNGQEVVTTNYGFFTQYVELNIGTNEFVFQNNNKTKTLTIIRKKTSTGGTGTGIQIPKVTYKEYTTEVYGVINSTYAMPRSKINDYDITLMPLTKGTTFRLLGEDKSYYKIADGSFVSKSSITRYNKKLVDNKVTAITMSVDQINNQVVAKFTMNVNALYNVKVEGQQIFLTLYDTVTTVKPAMIQNKTIKKVAILTDKANKTKTYCFTMHENATIYGYDVHFKDGYLRFDVKRAPELKEAGSLKGATVLLDAGHGDSNHGALGPMGRYGPTEKNINLAITLYAKAYLEGLGAKVLLTRSDDTFYSLSSRVETIRNARPDIAVSIHGNSLAQTTDYSKTRGFLTYYSYNLFGNLPNLMNDCITEELLLPKRDPRQRSFSLTRYTTCPSVLLETSFLSNPSDYEYLLQAENQEKFGVAIGKAITKYLDGVSNYNRTVYIVARGDTLAVIARKFNVTVDVLARFNTITDINHIVVGQKIQIPTN